MRTAEFISPQDPRWEKFLRTCRHDFYHLPEYVELCAKGEGATPAAFYAEDGHAAFLAPLLIRPIPRNLGAPEGWFDAVSPYGYSTPLATPSEVSLDRFLDAFCHAARQRGLVTAFFRLHPLLLLDHDSLGKFGRLTRLGQTVFIDLAKSVEEIWTRPDHRRNIRKLHSMDFTVKLDEWGLFKDFVEIYLATMRRVGARTGYLFSEEYFEDLRAALGERLHLCCVLSPRGDVAAAGLFVETDGIVQFHLSGTAGEYLTLAPSKLMLDFMRCWSHERKHTVLHLGAGLGGADDNLFQFKAGFSKDRAEIFTYQMILDEEMNDLLSGLAKAGGRGTSSSGSNFFPAYRAHL
jgi:Acetyltransferase (GNAT) domain